MFDIGWMELLVIGVVALIVVGPKDLPGMFRTVGRYVGKARAMARDFQRAMEQAADESGFKDATKGLDELRDIGGTVRRPTTAASKYAKENFAKIVEAKETGVPLKPGDLKSDDEPEPELSAPTDSELAESQSDAAEPDEDEAEPKK